MLPTRPKCIKVRARSAYEGSGIAGWLLAGSVCACFLLEVEDIAVILVASLSDLEDLVHGGRSAEKLEPHTSVETPVSDNRL
jgi:hypothetical protein